MANAADCIFCKIIRGEIPSYKVYEDDNVFAFLDIFPVHPGHVLVVPKRHCADIFEIAEQDLQQVVAAAKRIAPAVMKATNADGVNVGMNNKPAAGQVVMHAHVHVIPRFKDDGLKVWPQKSYDHDSDKEKMASSIKASLSPASLGVSKKGEIALSKTLLASILVLAAAVVIFMIIRSVLCKTGVGLFGVSC